MIPPVNENLRAYPYCLAGADLVQAAFAPKTKELCQFGTDSVMIRSVEKQDVSLRLHSDTGGTAL